MKSQDLFETLNDIWLLKERQIKDGNYYKSENTYWNLYSNYEIDMIIEQIQWFVYLNEYIILLRTKEQGRYKLETITDYFFNHFNNISNNRLVHIEMDSCELSRILFQKNTELRISCEALGGTTLYQDLINFDRSAQFDKDDIYIASTEKSYELFKRLYESNKILDLYETNLFFKTMTF